MARIKPNNTSEFLFVDIRVIRGKRFLFFALCSLLPALCFGQVASRTDGIDVFYYDSLHDAVLAATGTSIDNPDEITLIADIVLDEPLIVNDGVHIRLVAGGSDRTIKRSANNIKFPVIWIRGDSASLSLGKPGMERTRTEPLSGVASTMRGSPLHELVIDGGRLNSPSIEAHAPLIALNGPSAKLIMYEMAVLQNNINNGDASQNYGYQYGSGVYICTQRDLADRKAEFIMRGGTIRGNINDTQTPIPYGGAVQIQNYGIFAMEGGVIMDNTAHQGGGVYIMGLGSFKKTGGIIYGSNAPVAYRNTAITGLGTPPCYGHAVVVATSVSHLLGNYRSNTVGENENLSYNWNPQENGIFGKGDKWDTPGKALLRILLAIILPFFALVVCVIVILRIRYIKKLKMEIQKAEDMAAFAVATVEASAATYAGPRIDLEAMKLTRREKQICEQLLTNRPLKEIATILRLTYAGANFHAQNLYKKLGVENRTELLVRVKKNEK